MRCINREVICFSFLIGLSSANAETDILDCGWIVADPTNIHQVLINLCTNSVHAMEGDKGVLRIYLKKETLQPKNIPAEINNASNTFIRLAVSDTGSGMDKATLDRIFEPYFTTNPNGQGTGLGLSLVHGIVKSCNGFIQIHSEPDHGTTFNVYLPAGEEPENIRLHVDPASDALPASPTQNTDKAAQQHSPARIMMVDDEPCLTVIQRQKLEDAGYSVTAFINSQAALEEFYRHPDRYDMLISDQTMPVLTGRELTQKVLTIKPDLPVIICSGHSETFTMEDVMEMGIRKYLHKPLRGDELITVVRNLLGSAIA